MGTVERSGGSRRRGPHVLPPGRRRGAADASSCTATRPTPRTGCRSWSAVEGRRSRSTCRAGAFSERPPPIASTTRCTASAPSSRAFLDALGIGEHTLVVHDWGAVALIAAQRRPELLAGWWSSTRCRCCPAIAGTGCARLWRRRLVGELANATTSKAGLALLSAPGDRRGAGACRSEFIELVWRGRRPGSWPADARPSTAAPTRSGSRRRASGSARSARRRWSSGGPRTRTSRRASAAPTPSGSRTPSCSSSTAPATGPGSTPRRDRPGRRLPGGLAVPIRRPYALYTAATSRACVRV